MKRTILKRLMGAGLSFCSLMAMALMPQSAMAAWKQNNVGYWYTEGNSWAVGWRNIEGCWYYFDANGYMKISSWVETDGKWYFVSDTGSMLRSTTVNGYVIGADGAWIKDGSESSNSAGWKQNNAGWWYLEENGSYSTYWKSFDTKKYDENNERIINWYYFGYDGYMKTGWQLIDGKWYYFKESGEMAADEIIDGYILDKDGAMIDGLFIKNEDGDFAIKILDKENLVTDGTLKFCIINNSGSSVDEYWGPTDPGPYWIEKYVDGIWTNLHFKSPYDGLNEVPDYINIEHINAANIQTAELFKFEGFDVYNSGTYRIGFQAKTKDGKKYYPVYAEFEVIPQPGLV